MRRASTRARTAVFAPLGDVGRAGLVERRLAQAIRSGILADGEKLPSEPEMAAMLGVATVTAREALVSLRAQGLVTTTRGRGGGSFVTGPTATDAQDAAHRRLAAMSRVELADHGNLYVTILAGCAELAAERADAEDIADLSAILADTDTDGMTAAAIGHWRHSDTELHLAIASLTHSARLTREVIREEAEFGALLRLPLASPEHRAAVRELQRHLISAIGAGDTEGARRQMRRRVRSALEELAVRQAALH